MRVCVCVCACLCLCVSVCACVCACVCVCWTVENPAHCDFVKLRNMLVRSHMQDLKDVTRETHYENYRAQCIQSMTRMVVKERNRKYVFILRFITLRHASVTPHADVRLDEPITSLTDVPAHRRALSTLGSLYIYMYIYIRGVTVHKHDGSLWFRYCRRKNVHILNQTMFTEQIAFPLNKLNDPLCTLMDISVHFSFVFFFYNC